MISIGYNITSPNDPLKKVPLEMFWRSICMPKDDTAALVRQLRVVRNLNPKQYSVLKRNLPYAVCAMFNPTFRKTDNFAYTEYFILDLDHLSEKGVGLENLRNRVQSDSRVALCFVSPSEDGLKLFFRLSERCYDAGVFSLFYKMFAQQFARQYGIDQVLDARTCDVTRACFVSVDPQAYLNAYADAVDLKAFVNTESSFDFFELERSVKRQQQHKEEESAHPVTDSETRVDVGDDVYANIKAILNPDSRSNAPNPSVYVPPELEKEMEGLVDFVKSTGTEVVEIVSIQYGKKIRTRVGVHLAETNVFYGKRGYSVVVSPRTGTNPELNMLVGQLIKRYFKID